MPPTDALETVIHLNGINYNGRIDSIGEGTVQKKLLNAIYFLIPEVFNEKAKLEKVIQQSEAIKNNHSSTSSVTVEDVTNTEGI